MTKPTPRCFRGFRDVFAQDVLLKQEMIETVRAVYQRYGFVPLETPAVEFVDVLGKFLPESQTPEGGIFSFRNPDIGRLSEREADLWLALRYDLTAPLARVVAQYKELQRPFRRYQIGTVWRYEKPGPGRFREFTQFDFDSVGVPSVAADAESCCVISDVLEALGFSRGEYVVKVNNRKIMQGVLEACGLTDLDITREDSQAAAVLRAIDKLDRLGFDGVRGLLGEGRADESGDFTEGAQLNGAQIEKVEGYLQAKGQNREDVIDRLSDLIAGSEVGKEGLAELGKVDEYLKALGYGEERVVFDPTIIRGLSYYTGPVFEGVLTKQITDEDGRVRQFGSVFGGGRYDTLVERFTGQKVPATGASVGVDRLLEAVKLLRQDAPTTTAQVLVTVFDRDRLSDYFRISRRIREAGLNVELYLGTGGIGKQLKYADKMGIPLAIIAGEDEFSRGEYQIKDLRLGKKLAEEIEDREEWRQQPAQFPVSANEIEVRLAEMLTQGSERTS